MSFASILSLLHWHGIHLRDEVLYDGVYGVYLSHIGPQKIIGHDLQPPRESLSGALRGLIQQVSEIGGCYFGT